MRVRLLGGLFLPRLRAPTAAVGMKGPGLQVFLDEERHLTRASEGFRRVLKGEVVL